MQDKCAYISCGQMGKHHILMEIPGYRFTALLCDRHERATADGQGMSVVAYRLSPGLAQPPTAEVH